MAIPDEPLAPLIALDPPIPTATGSITENTITGTAEIAVQAGEVGEININNGPTFTGSNMAVQVINGGTIQQNGARFGGITKD
ncbi:hypothetical protein ACIQF6_14875 [Kitasatospora sp. NPDC092948]|uniref:hypothetical protein n=1 Tax=Kitasatospora sp. NPDC092948 TaxID=3364088 RepID=UPI0038149B06